MLKCGVFRASDAHFRRGKATSTLRGPSEGSRVESKQCNIAWILAEAQNNETWCMYFSSKLATIEFLESAATTVM